MADHTITYCTYLGERILPDFDTWVLQLGPIDLAGLSLGWAWLGRQNPTSFRGGGVLL